MKKTAEKNNQDTAISFFALPVDYAQKLLIGEQYGVTIKVKSNPQNDKDGTFLRVTEVPAYYGHETPQDQEIRTRINTTLGTLTPIPRTSSEITDRFKGIYYDLIPSEVRTDIYRSSKFTHIRTQCGLILLKQGSFSTVSNGIVKPVEATTAKEISAEIGIYQPKNNIEASNSSLQENPKRYGLKPIENGGVTEVENFTKQPFNVYQQYALVELAAGEQFKITS